MFQQLSVAVVIPAFNEERAITRAIAAVPAYVDRIVVVDDASADATHSHAQRIQDARVQVVRHAANRGVGGAIVTGYRRALAERHDVAVVMAGDGQMDPVDLPALLTPIADGRADYVKGNRFQHRDIWRTMPATRVLGNVALSMVTKVTSGYWRVFDSQCGYTAITLHALDALNLDQVFPRYGYPNDLLARLQSVGARVVDVPVRPVYGQHWRSGIGLHTLIYPISWVLLRSWSTRITSRLGGKPHAELPSL